jgi:hypothetical protein
MLEEKEALATLCELVETFKRAGVTNRYELYRIVKQACEFARENNV